MSAKVGDAIPALTEKAFAAQVRELAANLGYRTWWVWNSLHSPKGWPDLALARRCDCQTFAAPHPETCRQRFILAELKTAKGRVSPDQESSIDHLRASGVEVYVFRPAQFDEIVQILQGGTA